jgi:glycosyltransferase involved in cell wall biosynthesis
MFSIIVPLYNKAPYITKAINSVINQTIPDFELIIVNDGSTDKSLQLAREINDDRIRIINQENHGVSVARNNGVQKASFDYIAFLDADDWWESNYLAEMHKLIAKYPDAGIWAAKYFKVKYGGKTEANIGVEKEFYDGCINYFKVYAKTMWMPITSSSFIIRKHIFEQFGGFNPNLKLGEDFHLWSRIALKYKIAFLNKPLIYYNQDVDIKNRAIGIQKIYAPHQHYIFNLDQLEKHQNDRPDIKLLLDKLRLHALFKYRLANAFKKETQNVLKKVDINQQPLIWKLKYRCPRLLIKYWFQIKIMGSRIKTILLGKS